MDIGVMPLRHPDFGKRFGADGEGVHAQSLALHSIIVNRVAAGVPVLIQAAGPANATILVSASWGVGASGTVRTNPPMKKD
jgi:hypothetical protein